MKQSRLAKRKLSIKPTKKTKKRNFLKPFLILMFSLLFFVILFFLLSPKTWNGKSKIATVSQETDGTVSVKIFDPVNSSITAIEIPADTEVEAANQLGTWKLGSITKLGLDKHLGSSFLKNTVIKSFNFPVISLSELSLVDRLQIKLFTISVGSVNEVNLKDSNYLKRSQLIDGSLGWQISGSMPLGIESYFSENLTKNNLNIKINNSSGAGSAGEMVGNVVGVLGGNVASIQKLDKNDFDCNIVGVEKSLITKMASIFGCEIKPTVPNNNFDIEINIGTKFKNRF